MKKFFKALALVLALALVVGVVPAQSASAKIKAKKVLYTAAPQGWSTTDDTLKSSLKTKVRIYTLAGDKKAVAADHEYKAVIKSGEGIVDVTEKYVVGKKLGKAVVEIFKDGESLGTSVITVRKNADAETLKLVVKEGEEFVAVTADTEFVAGVTYRLALPRAKADSDERRLFVDDKAVEDVEGSARQYDVTFEKGEHTIAFEAFQGGVLDGATAKDSIKITAQVPQPKELKQLSANSFAVVFSHDMTGLIDPAKIKNDDIYYMIAGEKIVTGAIKSSVIDKEDPTRVVITRYTNFIEGETYYFTYGESKDDLSFKAAASKLENVEYIKVSVAGTCYVDETTEVLVKYFDKNDVELDLADKAIAVLDITSATDCAYQGSTSAGKAGIWFTAAGTATIKATVTLGYNEETYAPIEKTATVEVTGVKKGAAEVKTVNYSFGTGIGADKKITFIRLKDEGVANAVEFDAKFYGVDGALVTQVNSGNMGGYYLRSTAEDIVQIDDLGTGTRNGVKGVNVGNAMILLCYLDENNKEQVVKAFAIEVKEANKGTTNVVTEISGGTLNIFDFSSTADPDDGLVLKVKVNDMNGNGYDPALLSYDLKQLDNNAKSSGVTLTQVTVAAGANNIDTYNGDTDHVAWDNTVSFDIDRTLVSAVGGTNTTWASTGTGRVAFELTVKEGSTVLAKKSFSFVVANIDPADPEADGKKVNLSYRVDATENTLDTSRKNFKATSASKQSVVTVVKSGTKNGASFYLGTEPFTVIKSTNDIPVSRVAAELPNATAGAINYLIVTTPYGTTSTAGLVNANGGIEFVTAYNPTTGIAAQDKTSIIVKNFLSDNVDCLANNTGVLKSGTYTFAGVRVNYLESEANGASFKQKGSRISLSSTGVTVSGTDATVSYTEKTAITASNLEAVINAGGTGIGTYYKVTWDGVTSDDDSTVNNGRITVRLDNTAQYKVDSTTDSVYIYYLFADIKTYNANSGKTMQYTVKVPVNKLYKDK